MFYQALPRPLTELSVLVQESPASVKSCHRLVWRSTIHRTQNLPPGVTVHHLPWPLQLMRRFWGAWVSLAMILQGIKGTWSSSVRLRPLPLQILSCPGHCLKIVPVSLEGSCHIQQKVGSCLGFPPHCHRQEQCWGWQRCRGAVRQLQQQQLLAGKDGKQQSS